MMCLSKFIRDNKAAILDLWSREAAAAMPRHIDRALLRRHVEELLDCVADFIAPDGHPVQTCAEMARRYVEQRYSAGLEMQDILHEQCIIREAVIRLWLAAHDGRGAAPNGLLLFEQAMNESLREIINLHNERNNKARSLFLGALIHDLKNPVNAILQSMQLLPMLGPLNDRQAQLAQQVAVSAASVAELSAKLIDSVRIRLGKGIEIDPQPLNLAQAASQAVEEIRAANPGREIRLHDAGNADGCWDALRMREIVSNLVGNAVQYGSPDAPIEIWLRNEGDEVVLSVHNDGNPIPTEEISNIFDPLTRGSFQKNGQRKSSMGLGLFIAREVALAHGGSLSVDSTISDGTTFTLRVPRNSDRLDEKKRGRG